MSNLMLTINFTLLGFCQCHSSHIWNTYQKFTLWISEKSFNFRGYNWLNFCGVVSVLAFGRPGLAIWAFGRCSKGLSDFVWIKSNKVPFANFLHTTPEGPFRARSVLAFGMSKCFHFNTKQRNWFIFHNRCFAPKCHLVVSVVLF